jgi:AraC-like DNA-binding protein
MEHTYHSPDKLLNTYVRTVLVLEGFCDTNVNTLPIFTNGMPTLLCKTEKEQRGHEHIIQLTLFAKSIPADCWTTHTNTTVIAYFFKPFALTSLFNVSAQKLSEASIDLCSWSPHTYNALNTQLTYAPSTSRKLEVLDHLLLQQLKENQEVCEIVQYATDTIMCNSGKEILPQILKELKLNERTFQRIFKKYVGITPTQYRRICQFQLSFDQLRSKQFDKISDIALDHGFADQSHYIRSFKEFTQTTPSDYLQKGLTDKKE